MYLKKNQCISIELGINLLRAKKRPDSLRYQALILSIN